MRPDAFTFADAVALIDYFDDLGVSHLYLSPVLTAVDGSTHGYDVADPSTVSEGLGGRPGLEALADAARERGMGLVIDIVPNHVGVATHVRTHGGGTLSATATNPNTQTISTSIPAPTTAQEGNARCPCWPRVPTGTISRSTDPVQSR